MIYGTKWTAIYATIYSAIGENDRRYPKPWFRCWNPLHFGIGGLVPAVQNGIRDPRGDALRKNQIRGVTNECLQAIFQTVGSPETQTQRMSDS